MTTMMTRSFRLLVASTVAVISATNRVGSVQAIELTPDNWTTETAGKVVFVKFFAPWCGHCKNMKPAWDQLIEDYAGSKTALVADVDCTSEGGKELCAEHGVQGFPTLKYGHPDDLDDYQGPRDYDSLKEFADENLKPTCSPFNIDLCDADEKAEIQKYSDMIADGTLQGMIEEKEAKLAEMEDEFDQAIEKLQEQYQQLIESYEENQESIMQSGLRMMKAVMSASNLKNEESESKDEL